MLLTNSHRALTYPIKIFRLSDHRPLSSGNFFSLHIDGWAIELRHIVLGLGCRCIAIGVSRNDSAVIRFRPWYQLSCACLVRNSRKKPLVGYRSQILTTRLPRVASFGFCIAILHHVQQIFCVVRCLARHRRMFCCCVNLDRLNLFTNHYDRFICSLRYDIPRRLRLGHVYILLSILGLATLITKKVIPVR